MDHYPPGILLERSPARPPADRVRAPAVAHGLLALRRAGRDGDADRRLPGPARGVLGGLRVFYQTSVLCGAFLWVRKALDRPFRRFPARAVTYYRPTLMAAVPAILDTIRTGLIQKVRVGGGPKAKLFFGARPGPLGVFKQP